MTTVTVTVSVSDPETGLWCPACKLPSVIAHKISFITPAGVSSPLETAACTDCRMGFPIGRCR